MAMFHAGLQILENRVMVFTTCGDGINNTENCYVKTQMVFTTRLHAYD